VVAAVTETTVEATQETFQRDVVDRSLEVPVVVDFWAAWCGPCRTLAPVLEQAVAERAGQVALVKVDVDANQELAASFGVRGIPAVKAFRNGRPVADFVGAQPPAAVAAFLDALTAPPAADRLASELAERDGYHTVAAALRAHDYETALRLLLDRVADADDAERSELRETMVALFADLGDDDPLTQAYRRRLAAALY
jgi:putative thioredoxin